MRTSLPVGGVEIAAPPHAVQERVLTPPALEFVADLQRRFNARRLELPATFVRLLARMDLPFDSTGEAVVQMFENPSAFVGRQLAIGGAARVSSTLTNCSQQSEEWS